MKKLFNLKRLAVIVVIFATAFVVLSLIGYIQSTKAQCPCCTDLPYGGTLCRNPCSCDVQIAEEGELPINDPLPNNNPVANDDSATVNMGSSGNRIYVLANDNDPDENNIFIFSVQDSAHGTTSSQSGYILYTPDTGYEGSDSFSYTIGDGHGGYDSADVTVSVEAVNHEPIAENDYKTINEDSGATAIYVMLNDNDPDGDTISINSISQSPSHGSAQIIGDYVSYTPVSGYSGSDSFTYTISDGNGGTDSAIVTITIRDIDGDDEAPPANADADCLRIVLEIPSQPRQSTDQMVCYVGVNYNFESELGSNLGGDADVYFKFSWGDGIESSQWIGPRQPGETQSDSHSWQYAGIYDVRVKALVVLNGAPLSEGIESSWSKPFPIIVAHRSEVPDDGS